MPEYARSFSNNWGLPTVKSNCFQLLMKNILYFFFIISFYKITNNPGTLQVVCSNFKGSVFLIGMQRKYERNEKSAFLIVVFVILLFSITPAGATASLTGIQIYPKDHIWNVPVDTLPVHPMSDTYIRSSIPSSYMYIGNVFPINVVRVLKQNKC